MFSKVLLEMFLLALSWLFLAVAAKPFATVTNLTRSFILNEDNLHRYFIPQVVTKQLASLHIPNELPSEDGKLLEAKQKILGSMGAVDLTSSSSFTCEQLPSDYSPYLFCSGVVDYAFFVPAGLSISDLDNEARTTANYYPATLLSTSCLDNIKRDICAMIFMPCVSNGKRIF